MGWTVGNSAIVWCRVTSTQIQGHHGGVCSLAEGVSLDGDNPDYILWP